MSMKRKDFEDINDDFSFISLSSSSRKSRRLDGEFISIMQEDPRIILPEVVEQGLTTTASMVQTKPSAAIDAMPSSEERALVLYNPANTPFLKSPTSPEFTIIVNSDLIPGLKDHFFLSSNSMSVKKLEDEAAKNTGTEVSNDCLAVVPWVAPQFPLSSGIEAPATGLSDPMESDELEAEMMDMEDTDNGSSARDAFELGGMMEGAEGLPQWLQQQQYCMAPQVLQNTPSTPITW